MTDNSYLRGAHRNDEIDLVELLHGLWGQRWLIALVTILVTTCAAGYAFLSKPVYESRTYFLQPSLSSIAGLNLGRRESGLELFTEHGVYAVFTRNLQAEESIRRFFKMVYLPSLNEEDRQGSQDRLYERFRKAFSIRAQDKVQPDRYSLVVESHDPALAVEWARRYIDEVSKQSRDEVLGNARREIEVIGSGLQQQIKSLRIAAKTRREDRITQLKEALKVAEAIGLENPPVISGQDAEQISAFMAGGLTYMRGAKALRAELKGLEGRTSDDPFIPELRNLEEAYDRFTSMQADPAKVTVFRQDGEIEIPDDPIKPKRALILVLGAVLGGMIGIFIALIRLMLKKRSVAV
ncbi:LPS O-antigen chain length determinant protein WzzB [Metapseudomonas resinovorans]|uniref:LPS O-antigen chain length determinant protein WzzB n=1 Tax=Metapseudomonas resinovorans TaxID=53412 RepID=UPI001F2AF787|nr:Wzz/FepE/Etk N-terminal domain-containing protein [Pseudomonas resinovorans]